MALILTEEQQLLKDSARDFVANQWQLDWLREVRDSSDTLGFDPELWRQMAELGWTAIPFAEEHGGLGLGYAEMGVVLEELGRGLVVAPYLSSVVLGGGVVQLAGSPEQKAAILPGICDGSLRLAFAYQEAPRHAPYQVATQGDEQGNGFRVSGDKILVLDGASADRLVVLVRTSGGESDREGLTLMLIDPGADGVTIQRDLLLDSRSSAHVRFEEVEVAADAVLGRVGGAADVVDEVFDRAAVALSADMAGGIQESFERTVEYLKEREQFGVKIGSFQGLKHRAARWFCEVELTKSIVMEALRAIDEGRDDRGLLACTCKARASDAFALSGKEGIQMHGGMGVTDEADIGLFYKRARVSELLLGDSNYQRDRFATLQAY